MIKAPSLVRDFTWVWRHDDALDAPPADADSEALDAWERRLEIAADHGEWQPLIKPGAKATLFDLRLIDGTRWRAFSDAVGDGKFGPHTIDSLLVRLAIRKVHNFPAAEVKFGHVEGFGQAVKSEFVDMLDLVSQEMNRPGELVRDLAKFIVSKQQAPGPK